MKTAPTCDADRTHTSKHSLVITWIWRDVKLKINSVILKVGPYSMFSMFLCSNEGGQMMAGCAPSVTSIARILPVTVT